MKKKSAESKDDIEYTVYQQQIQDAEKELEKRESKSELFDYYLETGEILYRYYEIQDKISQGIEAKPTKSGNRAMPGSILAALDSAAKTEETLEPVRVSNNRETLRRDKLLEQYLLKIDPEHARVANQIDHDPYGECAKCEKEMIFSANEALFTCPFCGYQEFVLIDSDKPSYKDPPREVTYYAYKRINHFNEWLAQFQAKESTEIPEDVFQAILGDLRKERLGPNIKPAKVREILKKLKCTNFYEHVPYIMNRINGETAPVMSREVEEKLRYMFKEIQPSFVKHCPKSRSNFLSYSYVLYKFCELLNLDEYLQCFPLLKNRDKLYNQDKIWEKICQDMSWQYIKSL